MNIIYADETVLIIARPDDDVVIDLPTQGQQGPAGPQGPPGGASAVPGPTGETGPQGIPGIGVLYGAADPTAGIGVAGDFYINTVTHFIFGPKAGAWPAGTSLVGPQGIQGIQGIQGVQGVTGFTVLYGAADPAAGTGVDGDSYINTATNFIFGPKAAGAWPAGAALVGPQGPQGAQGIQGPSGTGDGDVSGPAGAVDSHIATFNGSTGKLIKDGGKVVADLIAKAGGTMSGPLVLAADPTAVLGISTKQYIDGKVAGFDASTKLAKAGDAMTGPLILSANPTVARHATAKQYTDGKVAGVDTSTKVHKSGDTMSGGLTVTGELVASTNYLRFLTPDTGGYINWTGGANYSVGGYGIWHTGNVNPANYVSNGRLVYITDYNFTAGGMLEPWNGAVVTGFDWTGGAARWRYMQLYTTGWFTTAYA
jgi:hypothetical protein